jgi:hypothetical protein
VGANLRGLGLDQIPVVNLRLADDNSRAQAEGDQIVDIDDQLAAMTAMRDEGKIGAIGLSSITLEGLRRAIPAGIVCVQNAYSLVARSKAVSGPNRISKRLCRRGAARRLAERDPRDVRITPPGREIGRPLRGRALTAPSMTHACGKSARS